MKRIIIVGDTFPTPLNIPYFTNGDTKSLFGEKLCQLFADADLRICNLEGALSNKPDMPFKTGPVLVAPTRAIAVYKRIGIDCCMLANNHITDGGHQGVLDTIKTLNEAGISYIGAGICESEIKRSLIYDLDGLKVGLYNVGEMMYNRPSKVRGGAWLYDEYIVCNEIAKLKCECDYLIVIYHGGIEQFRYPSPEIRKRFHRMADNGADMVLSQHTHCIGCEEWYNDSYLLYGQGNFLFRNVRPGQTDEGILIEIKYCDGKADVTKHLVKCVENRFVRYDEHQDFSAFNKRSMMMMDKDFVNMQFEHFCRDNLYLYLKFCKSPSILNRIIMKIMPKSIRYKFILSSYKQRDLMRIMTYLRSEQKREEAITGLELLLGDRH